MQRRLSLTEGTSDKFWYIDVVDDLVTVRYGRRGTHGTTKTKQYDTPDKAHTEAEKQIAAKLKKGYTDEANAPTPTTPQAAPTPKPTPVPEPEPEPVTVSEANPDDLGLRVTPFELAYDLSSEITIEADTEPFNPEAEAERAARILSTQKYTDYYVQERFVFSEPVFTTLPGHERRAWWNKHLKDLNAQRRAKDSYHRGIEMPEWVTVVLRTPWERKAKPLTQDLATRSIHALLARPVLASRSEEERREATEALPSPLPAMIKQNAYSIWKVDRNAAVVSAALGALNPDEVRELMAQLPDNVLQDSYKVSALLGLVLPTPEERVAFAKRVKARLLSWHESVPWLVATRQHGFDFLVQQINSHNKGVAEVYATTIAEAAHGPGVVPLFLDLLATKAGPVATEWLNSHITQALKARLSPSQAELLKPTLRTLTTTQLHDFLPHTSGATRVVVEELLAEATTPELPANTPWWAEAAVGLPKLPALPFDAAMLPPLVVDGHRLTPEQVTQVFQALSTDTDHPLTAVVRGRADAASRDRFALAIFHAWLTAGAVAKQAWCLTATGWLGDTRFVTELTPLIRQWPGQSQHQRAIKGLTALRNVATDTALQAISGIAATVKFAALKKRAGEAMDEIAQQRGLTRDELEDRILPDGGLDERGTRVFSYGTRQFLAFVTPDGKIAARLLDPEGHPTGKVLTSLPAPNKSDDPTLAKDAKAAYAAVKKDLTTLVKTQTTRFEHAMIHDRRWTPSDHATLIAPHPVLRRLLAGIIWTIHDPQGALTATARIDDDTQLVDTNDDPITVPEGGSIGIAHRLDLTDEQASHWGHILADYELTTPFKQLDRPTHTLPTSQGDKLELQGLPETKVPATKLISAFTTYGWQRGNAYDAGVYSIHYLPVPTADLTIVARYDDGLWMGPLTEQDDQTLTEVYVVQGIQDANTLGWGDTWDTKKLTKLPWTHIPTKITSEVLATINQIVS
ncbi:MAG: DUF4132 domain-containing protein [Propionibacteriaceae bacterium]|nr:DUF4132 domain-containing protein [Propionibacteriaceae bacterium]